MSETMMEIGRDQMESGQHVEAPAELKIPTMAELTEKRDGTRKLLEALGMSEGQGAEGI